MLTMAINGPTLTHASRRKITPLLYVVTSSADQGWPYEFTLSSTTCKWQQLNNIIRQIETQLESET